MYIILGVALAMAACNVYADWISMGANTPMIDSHVHTDHLGTYTHALWDGDPPSARFYVYVDRADCLRGWGTVYALRREGVRIPALYNFTLEKEGKEADGTGTFLCRAYLHRLNDHR